jgi:hypothetical protein
MILRNRLLWLAFVCSIHLAHAQEKPSQKIKLFIDCSNVWCDQTYIRSEINIIDFLLDRVSADVHMLITSQSLGNGGDRYQLIFYGQKRFAGMRDTLRFNMPPLATEVEIREKMLTNIKIGLVPYIAKTDQVSYLKFDLKRNEDDEEKLEDTTDAWNYWVFRLGANGNINTDQNYLNTNFNGNFSANRTTEQTRIDFRISTGKNRSVFKYENEDGEEESFTVLNTNYNINHTLVKSISDHWSYGYYFFLRNSTFSNIQNSFRYIPAIEYNIFPYKDVNNKYFAIGYGLDLRHNNYYEETIYNRMNENLIGHSARIVTSFNQKWGTLSSSVYYDAFFHDLKQMSLEINIQADVRLTGNLSFWAFAFGGLTRNQVFIPKGGTSVEDVLSRRRQLASGYNFGTFFGISYRFGSMLNNFVNPRFTDNF